MLKGTITDSLQNPLPFVNIIANPPDALYNIKFAISSEKGYYELDLKNTSYNITISHLGYESTSFTVTPVKETLRDIVLQEGNNLLETVVLELPVITKEDTIIYNVEKLVTGEERKLKDVLKKLPGVEVDRDGTITVRGKEVTQVLVENKKFFGGGSKLAIDNIPADAVGQIEILDNYNEVAFLKELQDSDEMALNVKLKEGKKNFVFGDIEAGKGNEDYYRAHANLFYYSPKKTLNAIENINNIREQVFTNNQYFGYDRDVNTIFKKGNTQFNKADDDFSQYSEQQDVVESVRKFGAVNYSQEVNTKLSVSGYAIFADNKEATRSETFNRYNTFTEDRSLITAIDNLFAIGNLKIDYLPNITDRWFLKTNFKKADNQYNSNLLSIVDTTKNRFSIAKNINETVFDQVVEWHKKKSAKHTFSALANYSYNDLTPKAQWTASDDILNGLIPVIEEPTTQLAQVKNIENHQLDAIFKHYWILNRDNHIYSTVGNTFLNQQFFTRDFQNLDDGSVNDFGSAGFGNDICFNLNDFFLGLYYKFQTGIFTFDQGAYVHHYQWSIDQDTNTSESSTVMLPSLSAEVKVSQSSEFNFHYNLTSTFSDVSQFANNFYLRSYNAVYGGNENLRNGLNHSLRLRFFKFTPYRGFRYYASAGYSEKVNGVIQAVQFEGINQSVQPIFIDDPETRWSFNGRISKKIKDVSFSGSFRYNASQYLQQVNNNLEENKNNNIGYSLRGRTLFDNLPTIEIGLNQGLGTYELSGAQTQFLTTEPFVNLDYDFWNGFIASFNYSYYAYKNKTLDQKNTYEIANASLLYQKENSAWSFKMEAQNLFNVSFKNSNSFSSYIISDRRTFILPRILVFSVGYKL